MRPQSNDYAPAFAGYVSLVPEEDVLSVIETQSSATQKLLASLDDTKAAFRYADGKWSVREVVGHLIDGERVFGYRALCIARGDQTPLPGFDEQLYARNANYDAWKMGDLSELYALSRRANIVFFRNLPPENWDLRGIANNNAITVRALAYVIAGHERHHLKVLAERYKV